MPASFHETSQSLLVTVDYHTDIVHPRFSTQGSDSSESVNNWAVEIMNGLKDLN